MDYIAFNGGDASLDGFEEYLNERDDRVFILSEGQISGFDTGPPAPWLRKVAVRTSRPPQGVWAAGAVEVVSPSDQPASDRS